MNTYDEDLSQNPFFAEFRVEHPELFEQCIANGWTICVPRVGTILSHIFTMQDFLSHVLVANEDLPETHFITLAEKHVRVANKVIFINLNSAGQPLEIPILFEETYYTVDQMKYTVWCIQYPLQLEHQLKAGNISQCTALCTLRDCIDFLWTESSGKDVLEEMDTIIEIFKAKFVDSADISMDKLKKTVGNLYTSCLQSTLSNRRLKERCFGCKTLTDNVKLAVETYVLHGVYKDVFAMVCSCSASEDARLNKIIRNLSEIQLRDMDVQQNFTKVIPMAKRNLSFIQCYSTVLGKVGCIRNTIFAINQSADSNRPYVSTDDLLPILIFLVIKCGLPNWYAHLNFIKHLRFSVHSYFQSDEVSFCISTLEAVIEHINSGIFSLCLCPVSDCSLDGENICDNFEMVFGSDSYQKHTFEPKKFSAAAGDGLQFLFEQVQLSNFGKVKEILERNKPVDVKRSNIEDSQESSYENDFKSLSLEEVLNEDDLEKPLSLCHPLCACKKCCRLLANNLLRTCPTVHSRDTHGFTLLHIASIHGKLAGVELALEMNADVNCIDFGGCSPLHYAASRGHQDILLLLLDAGAYVNKQNSDKNTPLHLACNNGHECCVKALLHYDHSKSTLKINLQNLYGDRPLHLASKWGYLEIADVLIARLADPWLLNNKGKNAFDVAHSAPMRELLFSKAPNMLEYVNINENTQTDTNISGSEISVLDLQEKTEILNSNIAIEMALRGYVKPVSTNDIRRIERVFRAIEFGDTKLACFFMNIDRLNRPKDKLCDDSLCHPLCDCISCDILKSQENKTTDHFDINTFNSQGDTALHIAVRHGRLEICEIILNNGAIPDAQNKNGFTPLHVAAQENRVEAAKLLMKYYKSLKIKDSAGNTPLHSASIAGSVDIVKLILEADQRADTVNYAGKFALDEAKDRMFLTIISLLEDCSINNSADCV